MLVVADGFDRREEGETKVVAGAHQEIVYTGLTQAVAPQAPVHLTVPTT